jgi:ribonuclease HII
MLDEQNWKSNNWIIGCDEVGFGAWAGPMVVCALAAPPDWSCKNLKDSKAYATRKARQKVFEQLRVDKDLIWNVQWTQAYEIDEMGMAKAHKMAMRDALDACAKQLETIVPGFPERVICDGDGPPPMEGVECIPKADATIPAVMAASVVAKVLRDDYMVQLAAKYKGYGFEAHVGYGTQAHEDAIRLHGICDQHRKSYKPIKKFLSQLLAT